MMALRAGPAHTLRYALAWLNRRPSLRLGWLVCRNVMRRWPLLGFVVVLVLAVCAALGRSATVARGFASAAAAPVIVAGVSAVLFASAALRRRRRLVNQRHRDWLASLPSDLSLGARAALAPALVWSAIALAIVAAASASTLPASALGTLLTASAAGCFLGAVSLAIFSGCARLLLRSRGNAGPSRFVPPVSRYAIVRRPRRAWATDPGLLPLGYWPLAQAKFWDRPKVRARSLVLLLLALPLGVPGVVALAASAVWLITLHLINLLLGVVRVAFAASWWLAPTPLRLRSFTAALSHRALLAEIASCSLLLGMTYAIGGAAALHRVLAPVIGWIGAVYVVSAAACALALQTGSVARSVLHRWTA